MAARKKPAPKRKPPQASPPDDQSAELKRLREELRAQNAARRADEARAADEEEDEGDDDDPAGIPLPTYDPRTHGVYALATHSAVPTVMCEALAAGDRTLKDFVVANSTASAKNQESMFTGFSVTAEINRQSLAEAREYANSERARADRLQGELSKKELEIAHMVRMGEEAQTERLRLKAEVDRGRLANERLALELDAKSRDRANELNAVVQASAPVFKVAAAGVQAAIVHYGGKVLGLPGAAPGTPPPAGPTSGTQQPGPPREEVQVALGGAKEWQAQVLDLFRDLKSPEPVACLRAMLCSYALQAHGAPPLPSIVTKELLFELLTKDLGEARVIALLQSCNGAYVVEGAPPPPRTVDPTVN